ncbi:Pr6Pr family membrane protein [Nonomuraea rhodomycinica]|uniref:Pr6Pr family membrane protein n=1 Tax=Nonomuraea rhodomycinica TaxID=1712872 RepID=A0A7Y6MHC8_9ACTN|nr:Pr6Pr family membrane protein [Nonomuraea rhodomycinica]NUW46591.1 Pr6Pr family membrane protein [Nonomuraea rhodomycinica]
MRVIFRVAMVSAAVVGIVCLATAIRTPWVYFTAQSNVLLVLYYGWRLLGGQGPAGLKGAVTLYLTITGLVAHFYLTGGGDPLLLLDRGPRGMGNLLLHYVTPLMAVTDWLVWDRDRRPSWAAPLGWLAFPLVYAAFVLVRAPSLPPGTRRRYVYPFLDVGRLGWDGFAVAAAVLAACFVVTGYALLVLHRLAGRRSVAGALAEGEPG